MNGAADWLPGYHPAQALINAITANPNPPPCEPERKIPVPDAFQNPGGVLGDFVDYVVKSAPRPQPILALAAGLALIGTVAGRRYCTPTNLRTNVYVVGMAESGGGKDHARRCVAECLTQAGLGKMLGGESLASGAGLNTAMLREPSSIFQIDEFGQFLHSAIDKRKAPKHLSDIWDNMTKLFTSAASTYQGTEYANQKERPREIISQPCCVMHATTVPATFWRSMQSGAMSDGSLARWLVFQSDNLIPDRVKQPARSRDVPERLLLGLQAIAKGADGWNGEALAFGPVGNPDPYVVPYDDAADRELDRLADEITERQRESLKINPAQSATLARIWEHTVKISLIKAISDNPIQPEIDLECVRWAFDIVQFCTDTLLKDADKFVSDNETEATSKRVFEIIRKAGNGGIAHSALQRKTQWLNRKELHDIIGTLCDAETIVIMSVQTATKPGIKYIARRLD